MKSAEVYLKNREWRFASTHLLKEAITYIIKHQPKYLFIAADHPSKKVRMLPKLIAQAFPITVIAYTESTSNQTLGSIQSMGLEHNLYPPVSGPAIVRLVAKIEKDLEQKEKEEKLRIELLKQQQVGNNEIKDPSSIISSDGDTTIIRDDYKSPDAVDESATSNALAQAKAALQQMLQTDNDEPISTFDSVGTETINFNDDKPETQKKGMAYMPSASEGDPQQKNGLLIAKGGGKKISLDPSLDEQALKSPTIKKYNSQSEQDLTEKDQDGSQQVVEILNSAFQSLVLDGAVDSLEGSLNHKISGNGIEKIEELNQVVCLVIDSTRFSGYLIAAMGHKRVIDDALMDNIKSHLHDFMRKNGIEISEKDSGPLTLKVQQVGFQDWAKDQAEFLIRSIHNDNEVAMAFFPTKDVKVSLEESFAEHMMKMKIDEISANMELEFDVFVYFPENQKYIKYNKEGQKMFGEQVNRLKDKGVTYVHMKKDSRDQVRKYKAQNYLNEKILSFKNKKSA